MTPHEVAADQPRLLRFQNEVAYLDRMRPSEDEVRVDTELLGSKDGVLVIAWLWPNSFYSSAFDPFVDASRENQLLWEYVAKDSKPVGEEPATAFRKASRAIDRRRQRRREVTARRFDVIIRLTATAVGCSVEDLKTHLQWATPLTELELERLLHGDTPFPFPVIVRLCSALQLVFTDAWVLVEPQRLAHRIAQSVLASEISDHLRLLTLDNLKSAVRKLPRASVDAEQAQGPDTYSAPRPGGRYWSLYEALAADERQYPNYTIAEIDRLLVEAGEPPLPVSATTDRSWWAGTGAKTEGRPQVSAWWAAGYRIRSIAIDPSSGGVASIRFIALPGRGEWLVNPERTAQREYRIPGPLEVGIYPDVEGIAIALTEFASQTQALRRGLNLDGITAGLSELSGQIQALKKVNLEGIAAGFGELARSGEAQARDLEESRAVLDRLKAPNRSNVPDDPDIRHLIEFLRQLGEADRSQIERHFSQLRNEPVDAAWMTNLLTKARRQGWTTNNGTRSRPRWTTTLAPDHLAEDTAATPNSEKPIDSGGAVPLE